MNETQNIWEMNMPVARSFQDMQDLANHTEHLREKVVTIENITIGSEEESSALTSIVWTGALKEIRLIGCSITTDDSLGIVVCSNNIVINHCNLSCSQALDILDSLDPYGRIDSIDLSNNNLNDKDKDVFLDYLISRINSDPGFNKIILSGNNFDERDVSRTLQFVKNHPFCTIIF